MKNNGGYFETTITRKGDHYEVYVDGELVSSADTVIEAAIGLEEYLGARRKTEEWMDEFVSSP